jgi:diguanylate cyclase (GGDEF)-like protein
MVLEMLPPAATRVIGLGPGGALEQADALADFAERLDLAAGEPDLGRLLLVQTRQLLRPAAVALLLVDETTHEFVTAQTLPKRSRRRWESELEAHIAAGTFAWGINQRQPVLLPLRTAAPPLPGARTLVLTPLVARYRLLGALLVATEWAGEAIPAALVRWLAVLAKQFTLTLGTHRLVADLQRRNHELALAGEALAGKVKELEEAQTALRAAIAAQAQKSEELERLKAELEAKVLERTAELRALNRQLERLSRTDELTGLLNRRSFEERLAEEELRRQRTGRPVTVAIVDLNGLKGINDRQGHAAGDAALVATATVLQTSARGSDVVARLGGDEFGLLLTETGADGAEQFCQRLLAAAAEARWQLGQTDGLSLSIGTASCPPVATLPEALAVADARMYANKRAYYAQLDL